LRMRSGMGMALAPTMAIYASYHSFKKSGSKLYIHALESLGRVGKMGWVRWSTGHGHGELGTACPAPLRTKRSWGGHLALPHLLWCSKELPLFLQLDFLNANS
jgi:hypothetical protein